MKLKTKKIIAREILFIIFSSIICILAFWIGGLLDNAQDKNEEKLNNEILVCENKIDNYHNKFLKIQKVDSIIKLQERFYSEYSKLLNNDTLDHGNYFFWKNVRKSILDSTFHFTYAKDEFIYLISINNEIYSILNENKQKRLNDENVYCSKNELRNEFKLFALSNSYEKYISLNEWKNYQELRERKMKFEKEMEMLEKRYYDYEGDFFRFTFIFCLSLLFFLRYFFYLLKWCFRIINSKEV